MARKKPENGVTRLSRLVSSWVLQMEGTGRNLEGRSETQVILFSTLKVAEMQLPVKSRLQHFQVPRVVVEAVPFQK